MSTNIEFVEGEADLAQPLSQTHGPPRDNELIEDIGRDNMQRVFERHLVARGNLKIIGPGDAATKP